MGSGEGGQRGGEAGRYGCSMEVSTSPKRTQGGVGVKGTEVGSVLATPLCTCPFQVPSTSQCGDLKKKRKENMTFSCLKLELSMANCKSK